MMAVANLELLTEYRQVIITITIIIIIYFYVIKCYFILQSVNKHIFCKAAIQVNISLTVWRYFPCLQVFKLDL